MPEGKHTPGPWKVVEGVVQDIQAAREGDHRLYVAEVCKFGSSNPGEIAANQHLIAAAPDLLEALEEALSYIKGPDGYLASVGLTTTNKMRAAVAKAQPPHGDGG